MIVYNRSLPHKQFRSRETPTMILRGLSVLPALALAAVLAGCDRGDSSARAATAQQGPPPVPAKVREVKPQSVPIVIEVVGQVQGSKEVEVRARVTGILQKRLYNEGQRVQAGAP